MKRQSNCPKCKSSNIDYVQYLKDYYLICDSCGFDETMQFQAVAEQNKSQKAKANFTPYKTGRKK